MLAILLDKYKNSKQFVGYFILTYIDKIISFALPLSILFIIKDKDLYSFVEVAFSYATLAMVVVDLGLSSYLFFGYKKSTDKDKFLRDSQFFFKFILLLYCLFLIPCLLWINYYNKEFLILFSLVFIRTLFTFFTTFYSSIFRLKDNPSGIYLITIIVNVASFILLLIADYLSFPHKIIYFFIPSILLILWISLKYLLVEMRQFHFNDFKSFLKDAIQFSWPIILNVLAMSYINNYAKIYAYANLSQQEMVQVSYILRIGLIVQLTHSSFSSFFSKSLFMDVNEKFNFKIFKQYNIVLLLSAFLVVLIIIATNYFFSSDIHIPLTLSTCLFLLYIILWCYVGYLELYFGVMNANKKILYYSIISVVIYTLLLKLLGNVNLLQLSVCMVIAASLNLTLVIIGLKKMQVFNLKTTVL